MEATALAGPASRGQSSERPQSGSDPEKENDPGSIPSSPKAFRDTGDGETSALLGLPSAGAGLRRGRARQSVSAPSSTTNSPFTKSGADGGGKQQGQRSWIWRLCCRCSCCGGGWCCQHRGKNEQGGPKTSRAPRLLFLLALIILASLILWQTLRAQVQGLSSHPSFLQKLQQQELLQALSVPLTGAEGAQESALGTGRSDGVDRDGGAQVSPAGSDSPGERGTRRGKGKGRRGKGEGGKEGKSKRGGKSKKGEGADEGPEKPLCGQLSWNGTHVLRAETNCSHVTDPNQKRKRGKKGRTGLGKHRTRIAMSSTCDLYDGRWVKDNTYPLYQGRQCAWLAKNWACRNGLERPSFAFENFRWQPRQCDLPKFNASDFLGRLRNKVVAFVGDSLGQQQFQSLLCMLDPDGPAPDEKGQSGEAPGLPVRNRTGAPIDIGKKYGFYWIPGTRRPTGWAYLFPASNTTVLFRWSTCLCQVEPIDPANATEGFRMHLDRPDEFLSTHLPHLDLLVLNTGHHWNRVKLKDHFFHVRGQRLPTPKRGRSRKKVLTMAQAHELTVAYVAKWLDLELQRLSARGVPSRQLVMLRARSPRHFLGGEWNSGGRCDHIQSPLKAKQVMDLMLGEDPEIESAVGSVGVHPGQKHAIQYLNISFLSALRGDAHPSKWDFRGVSPKAQDCLHWCLPGVPDVWNEIMYAKLALHQAEQRLREGKRASLGGSFLSMVMGTRNSTGLKGLTNILRAKHRLGIKGIKGLTGLTFLGGQ